MNKIWKWFYNKNKVTRVFYMYVTLFIRMPLWILIGRADKSRKIINEHFDW
jgi:hypothetical protein